MIPFQFGFFRLLAVPVPTCWYNFDGVNEYITANNISPYSTDAVGTISFWFKTPDVTPSASNQRLFSFGDADAGEYITIYIKTNTGNLSFACADAGVGKWAGYTSSNHFTDNTWHHVAIVQDGIGTGVIAYIDGVSRSITWTNTVARATWLNTLTGIDNLAFGVLVYNNSIIQYCDMSMDEVSYWNSILSSTDVLDIYNLGRDNPDLTIISSYNLNCISHWKMGEIDILYDFLSFNGVNEYVNIDGLVSSVSTNTTGSMSLWFRTTDVTHANYRRLFSFSNSSNVGYLDILLQGASTGKIQFAMSSNGSAKFNGTVSGGLTTDNTWHHLMFIQDGTSPKLYLDGISRSITWSVSTDLTAWCNDLSGMNAATIGALRYNNTIVHYHSDDLDEVFYSNLDLSSDALDIYNLGISNPDYSTITGIVSHWKMDSYNPVDQIGINNGTGVNMDSTNENIEWEVVDDVDRQWTDFNGSNEYVNCGNDSSLDFEYNLSFSHSVWVNRDVLGTGHMILSKVANSSPYRGYSITFTNTNKLGVNILNTNGANGIQIQTTSTYNALEWYHIAFTYDGSSNASGVKIYVNGISQSLSITRNDLSATIITTAQYSIGSRSGGAPYNGGIDEVLTTSSELTSTEVADIYNLGRITPDYSAVSGIVSHWRMNELNPADQIGINNGTSVNQDSTNLLNDKNDGISVNMDSNNKECE